jgi:hypothetical protein
LQRQEHAARADGVGALILIFDGVIQQEGAILALKFGISESAFTVLKAP